jgi:hypothetical protein
MGNLRHEALGEGNDGVLQSGLEVLAEGALLVNRGEQIRLVGLEMRDEVGLPFENLVNGNGIEVTVDTGVYQGYHLVDGHGRVLLLLEELGQLWKRSLVNEL